MKKLYCLLLLPLCAQGAPGGVTRYLINEPASMLDVGMVRLENLTTWFKGAVGLYWRHVDINSEYDPETDKIYVSISASDTASTAEQMQDGCREALRQLQIVVSKSLPDLFRHVGYRNPMEPKELDSTLRGMFEFSCSVYGRSSSDIRFHATQTFDTTKMSIGEPKRRN
jgi:hypothetical protein